MSDRLEALKSQLSPIERKKMAEEYDSGMKIKEIMAKHSISTNAHTFLELLPSKESNEICPKCGNVMRQKRNPRTSPLSQTSSHLFCVYCGHSNSVTCECPSCKAQREEEYKRELEKRRQLYLEKVRNIKKFWGDSQDRTSMNTLSLYEKIDLAIILRASLKGDKKRELYINGPYKYYPNDKYTLPALKNLMQKNVLRFADPIRVDAFSEDGREIVDFKNAIFTPNIIREDVPELISFLHGATHLTDDEFISAWKYLAKFELMEYLNYEMNNVDLACQKMKGAADESFSEMLSYFSLSQCLYLIHMAVRDVLYLKAKNKMSQRDASNLIFDQCTQRTKDAVTGRWNFREYNLPYSLTIENEASHYLYYELLQIGKVGRKYKPCSKSKLQEIDNMQK